MTEVLFHTLLAGLATGLGGVVALCRLPSRRALGSALGFAGGVMLCASLMDLLPGAAEYYRRAFSPAQAALATVSLLCMGMAVAAALGRCLPEEFRAPQGDEGRGRALRSAAVTGMALLLHNLPEGVLTLFAGVADERMGLRLCVAVALHNLPEGIAVALPLYYATQSRAKAALAALVSGLAEPVGALIAYLFLHEYLNPSFLNGLMILIAGVMIWVSLAELWPEALEFGKRRAAARGMAGGILLMTLGIVLLS